MEMPDLVLGFVEIIRRLYYTQEEKAVGKTERSRRLSVMMKEHRRRAETG